MFSILLLLSFRSKYRIYSTLKQTALEDFGFNKNGSYKFSFEISNTFDEDISLVLLNSTLYSEQKKNFFGYFLFHICDNETILNMAVPINHTNPTLSGSIQEKTIIHPYLLRCNPSKSQSLNLNLVIQYQNQNSHLDTRLIPAITNDLVIFIIYLFFIGVWSANWSFHFTMKIHLHNILTLTLILFSITQILRYYELKTLDKSDNSHGITEIRLTFVTLSYFFLSLFLLFISHGLNICTEKVSIPLLILYITLSLWVSIFPNLYFNVQFGKNQRYIVLMNFVGFVAFLIVMINIKNSMSKVVILLITSPSSLPSSLTYLLDGIYYYFSWCLLGILACALVVGVIWLTVSTITIWVEELLVDLVTLVGLISFCVLFRLRSDKQIYKTDDDISSLSLSLSITPEQPLLANDNI